MATSDSLPAPRLRHQVWALHAYEKAEGVPSDGWKNYERVVNDLGVNVLRLGLAGAMAAVERERERGGSLLLQHLAAAAVLGLEGVAGSDLPDRVRRLDLDGYMIATREILQVAAWLRRAVQARSEVVGADA